MYMKPDGADTGIKIMGILNLTPDSFHEPSRYNMGMLESAADIVDIGACSTRPGSVPVSEKEEWNRLEPVLRSLPEAHVPISIDTFRSGIVLRAYDIIGPFIVNDVSGAADPRMLPTVRELGLGYVAMHNGPAPDVSVVVEYFRNFSRSLDGIEWILDPGFGFGKTKEENWNLLRHMDELCVFGRTVLAGVSRKRMTDGTAALTRQAHFEALAHGAGILRVHDVEDARRTVKEFYSTRYTSSPSDEK